MAARTSRDAAAPGVSASAPYHAIIVLGAALAADGRPTATLRRRVAHGVAAWRRGLAPHLMLCGGVKRHPPPEAEVMAGLARAAGVPESALVVERQSRSTLENAACAARLMAARGWTAALLVTDRLHLPRALLAFRHVGLDVAGSPVRDGWREAPPARAVGFACREAAALAWYGLRFAVRRLRT